MTKYKIRERIHKIRDYLTGDEEVPIMYMHAIIAIVGSVSVLLILEFGELPLSHMQHTILVLVEKSCVIVVIAYVISRLSYFGEVLEGKFTIKNQAILILIFGAISIFGTYSGIDIFGAMANVRDLGPMVAGLIGGPILGLGAGLIGGLYRLSLGGFTAVPCAISTILAGFLAGLIYIINKRQFVGIFWAVIFAILMESLHMLINLVISQPYSQALTVVEELSAPMIIANALGMFIFAFIISNLLREKKTERERDLYFDELERNKHELKLAKKIQKSFFPEKLPKIPGFDLAALTLPAHESGGDFYDFIPLKENKLGVTIADVKGASFPASLLMALSRTILRGEAKHKKSPQVLLNYLNKLIAVDIGPEVSITILYGELDFDKKSFNYVNASHLPPLLFRSEKQKITDLEKDKKTLGRLENLKLKEHHIQIQSGDMILFYTDSVVKSLEDDEKTGKEILRDILIEFSELPAIDIVGIIKQRAGDFKIEDALVLALLKAN